MEKSAIVESVLNQLDEVIPMPGSFVVQAYGNVAQRCLYLNIHISVLFLMRSLISTPKVQLYLDTDERDDQNNIYKRKKCDNELLPLHAEKKKSH